MATPHDREIIVFDALCVLCSANAQFILRHDRDRHFLLASMQDQAGKHLLAANGLNPDDPDTLIVVTPFGVIRNSDAVIHIYAALGWPWRAAAVFSYLPRGWRDSAYLFVARHRYRLFGQRNTCWVPDAADRERLL